MCGRRDSEADAGGESPEVEGIEGDEGGERRGQRRAAFGADLVPPATKWGRGGRGGGGVGGGGGGWLAASEKRSRRGRGHDSSGECACVCGGFDQSTLRRQAKHRKIQKSLLIESY